MSDQTPAAPTSPADGALKTLAKQFAKSAEKQPGWLYLLTLTFFVAPALELPPTLWLGIGSVNVPGEVWVTIVAVIAYIAGDALDRITFKKLATDKQGQSVWVQRYPTSEKAITGAEDALGIAKGGGLYSVSMKVLEAAHDVRPRVHMVNELAKTLRGAILLLSVAVLVQIRHRGLPWEQGLPLALATLSLAMVLGRFAYPMMKTSHITKLYESVPQHAKEMNSKGEKQLTWFDAGEARLFFWEGLFIASAKKAPPKEKTS